MGAEHSSDDGSPRRHYPDPDLPGLGDLPGWLDARGPVDLSPRRQPLANVRQPDDPVPMIATRLPVKSKPSFGNRLVKSDVRWNVSIPEMPRSSGVDRQPVAAIRYCDVRRSPASVSTAHVPRVLHTACPT